MLKRLFALAFLSLLALTVHAAEVVTPDAAVTFTVPDDLLALNFNSTKRDFVDMEPVLRRSVASIKLNGD